MTEKRCDNCKFWKPEDEDSDDGQCRRNAPSPVLVGLLPNAEDGQDLLVWWPQTFSDEWCGQHESSEPEAPDQPDLRHRGNMTR